MTIERAFCLAKEHIAAFKAYGLSEKLVYLDGRGAEDLEACLGSFRDRPGKILIAPDLTVFGDTKKAITAIMTRLERARIRVSDVIHPQDETHAELTARAFRAIDSRRFPDKRTARRRGRQGGLIKGEIAKATRAQIDTDRLIKNLVKERHRLGWPTILRICGGKIAESTLRRHYMFRQTKAKKNGRAT